MTKLKVVETETDRPKQYVLSHLIRWHKITTVKDIKFKQVTALGKDLKLPVGTRTNFKLRLFQLRIVSNRLL